MISFTGNDYVSKVSERLADHEDLPNKDESEFNTDSGADVDDEESYREKSFDDAEESSDDIEESSDFDDDAEESSDFDDDAEETPDSDEEETSDDTNESSNSDNDAKESTDSVEEESEVTSLKALVVKLKDKIEFLNVVVDAGHFNTNAYRARAEELQAKLEANEELAQKLELTTEERDTYRSKVSKLQGDYVEKEATEALLRKDLDEMT